MLQILTKKFWTDLCKRLFLLQPQPAKRLPRAVIRSRLKPCERISLKRQMHRHKPNIATIRLFIKFAKAERGKLHNGWLQVRLEADIYERARYYWGKISMGGMDKAGQPQIPHEFANCWLSEGRLCFAVYDRRRDYEIVRIARAFADSTGILVRVGGSNGLGRGSQYFHSDQFLDYPATLEDQETA